MDELEQIISKVVKEVLGQEEEESQILEHFASILRKMGYTVNVDSGSNYVLVGKDNLKANVQFFDEPSEFGINNGHISRLTISDTSARVPNDSWANVLVNYDRGWDIFPSNDSTYDDDKSIELGVDTHTGETARDFYENIMSAEYEAFKMQYGNDAYRRADVTIDRHQLNQGT